MRPNNSFKPNPHRGGAWLYIFTSSRRPALGRLNSGVGPDTHLDRCLTYRIHLDTVLHEYFSPHAGIRRMA